MGMDPNIPPDMMGLPDEQLPDMGMTLEETRPSHHPDPFFDSSEYGETKISPTTSATAELEIAGPDPAVDVTVSGDDLLPRQDSGNLEEISVKKIEDMEGEYGKMKQALLSDISKSPIEPLVSPTPIIEPPFLRNAPVVNPNKPLERTRSKDKLESIFGGSGSFEDNETPLIEDEDLDAIFEKNKMENKIINEPTTSVASGNIKMPRELSPPPERRNSGGSASLRSLKNERQRQHQEQQQIKMQKERQQLEQQQQLKKQKERQQHEQQLKMKQERQRQEQLKQKANRQSSKQPQPASSSAKASKFNNEQYPLSPDELSPVSANPRPSTNPVRQKDVYTIPEVSEEEEESPLGGDGVSKKRGRFRHDQMMNGECM